MADTAPGTPTASVGNAEAESARAAFDDLDDDILDGLASTEDDDEGTGDAAASQTDDAAAAAGSTTGASPAATPAAGETAPTDGTAAAAATPAPTAATPAATPAPAVTETPEQKAEREAKEKEARTKWLGELETSYAIPEEDHAALMTEPEKVIPKLAARLHARMIEEIGPQIVAATLRMVPQLVGADQQFQARESKARTDFFGRHPYLQGQPEDVILKAGQAYRQVHPDATAEEAMEGMAQLAARALKLQYIPHEGGASSGSPTPTPRKMPKPAAPGGGGHVPQPSARQQQNTSEWDELAGERGS